MEQAVKRTPVNNADWGQKFLMNQGEVIEGATRHLTLSGQVAFTDDPDGEMGIGMLAAPEDLRGQLEAALANVDALLSEAGMDRSNIVQVHLFTTDVDGLMANYDVYAEWIRPAGVMPPQSLLGVQRLALPELLVEVEVSAAAGG